MKRNLLTVGLLSLSFAANAQLAYVGDAAKVFVSTNALVYSGGDAKVDGTGNFEVHGNVLIDNGGLATAKTDGTNFTLNLDDTTTFRQYGQLWINNTSQSQVTGTVTKEYRDSYHGVYEQTALPFIGKTFSTLNNEIVGANFTDTRFINGKASGQNVLGHNNLVVREDLFTLPSTTSDPTQYYILGAAKLDPGYFPNTTSSIKGIPAASGISKTLADAGLGIDFGNNGNAQNYYRQKYNTYLYDAWDASTNNWTGDYGRNIYQYGNPFLTNLDLTLLPANVKNAIKGIRYSVSGTSTNLSNTAASASYLNFTTNGVGAGDVAAIIKPMQEFAIKLKDNTVKPVINFDNLRTFSNSPSNLQYNSGISTARFAAKSDNITSSGTSTVKQLDVIALDANKNEIARTYYVVYPEAHSGASNNYSVQATAVSTDIMGTFEENSQGGIDSSLTNTYWLYINEANENDFKGKRVPLAIFSDKIAYLKFNVRENMQKIPEKTANLSSGESFYINTGDNVTELSQDLVLPVPTAAVGKDDGLGLYYGRPTNSTVLSTVSSNQRPSATFIAWDDTSKDFKIVFDRTWKTADIQIFDMSGRMVSSETKVSAETAHTLIVPNTQSSYIVHAKSESGALYIQKILKK